MELAGVLLLLDGMATHQFAHKSGREGLVLKVTRAIHLCDLIVHPLSDLLGVTLPAVEASPRRFVCISAVLWANGEVSAIGIGVVSTMSSAGRETGEGGLITKPPSNPPNHNTPGDDTMACSMGSMPTSLAFLRLATISQSSLPPSYG